MEVNELIRKRRLIWAARVRTAPEAANLVSQAVDRMVEQAILAAEQNNAPTLEDLEHCEEVAEAAGVPAVPRTHLEASIQRLVGAGRVLVVSEGPDPRYALTEDVRQQIEHDSAEVEIRLQRVATRLFQGSGTLLPQFRSGFIECLASIFSVVGSSYTRVLLRDYPEKDLVTETLIAEIATDVAPEYPGLDPTLLIRALTDFFSRASIDDINLKWHLTQSAFITTALGMDQSSALLSQGLFSGATFVLDTPILIESIDPSYRGTFKRFWAAAASHHIRLQVCHVSLDELTRVVGVKREALSKHGVLEASTRLSQLKNDTFYRMYIRAWRRNPEVTFDQVFSRLLNPEDYIEELLEVEVVRDRWFDSARGSPAIDRIAKEIQRRSVLQAEARRSRRKGENASIHDALVSSWVSKNVQEGSSNTWFVTTDHHLASQLSGLYPEEGRPNIVTLDTLMQWASPLGIVDRPRVVFGRLFAELINRRLVPSQSFIQIEDVGMLAEWDETVGRMPEADLDAAARLIARKAVSSEPTMVLQPEIASELGRFFSGRGRRYQEDLTTLERERDQHAQRAAGLEAEVGRRDKELEDLRNQIETRRLRASAHRCVGLGSVPFLVAQIVLFGGIWFLVPGVDLGPRIGLTTLASGVLGLAWQLTMYALLGEERLAVFEPTARTVLFPLWRKESQSGKP